MTRKRVLLDVDGVSADFVQATLDSLVQLGGPRMHHDDVESWHIFDCIPPEYRDRISDEWRKPGWCANIPLYPGAQDGIELLRGITKAEVLFVTTAMEDAPFWMWEREQWLRKYFDANHRTIVFTAAKYAVDGEVFVDDKLPNVLEWAEHHPHGQAVLWASSTNQHDVFPSNIHRTCSWFEVMRLVSAQSE